MAYFTAAELEAMAQAGVVPPAVTPAMLEYCRLRYVLIGVSLLYSVLSLLAILHFGIAAKLRDFLEQRIPNNLLRVPLFYLALSVMLMLLRLPFSYFAGYHIEHQYGLSEQNVSAWFGDLLKARGVDVVINSLVLTVAFAAIQRFPRLWPQVLWFALVPLIAGGIFVAPLVIDPLYNKFSPMPPGEMRTGIERIARDAGIPNAPIFVVDKSRQTRKLNAYVTGLGSSTRIVIWDNTLNRLPADQVRAIVAHEAGHYVLGHIILGFVLISAGLAALLLFLQRFGDAVIKRLPARWGVRGMTDVAVIPVVLLFAGVGSFFFAPLENTISRVMEQQADSFGLTITNDGPAMARTFVSLSEQNLAEPAPPAIIQFWFFSHPSLKERILFSLGLNR